LMKHTRSELENLSKAELIELVMSVEDRYYSMLKRVEELERTAARTAAPFSKNRRKFDPQKPGRKIGQGKFEGRKPPSEEDLSSMEEVVSDALRYARVVGNWKIKGLSL